MAEAAAHPGVQPPETPRWLSPDERRGQNAVLTDDGFAALEAAAPFHVESVRRHLFDVLSTEQLAQLRAINDTLLEHLLPVVKARGDGRPEHFERVAHDLEGDR